MNFNSDSDEWRDELKTSALLDAGTYERLRCAHGFGDSALTKPVCSFQFIPTNVPKRGEQIISPSEKTASELPREFSVCNPRQAQFEGWQAIGRIDDRRSTWTRKVVTAKIVKTTILDA